MGGRILALGGILLAIFALEGRSEENLALSGKWHAVEGTRDGVPLKNEELAPFQIKMGLDAEQRKAGGRTGWEDPLAATTHSFHGHPCFIDLAATPARISLVRLSGLKATTYPGILKLDGEHLIVCWNLEPWLDTEGFALRTTPKEFAAPKGSGFTLLVFEKAKE